MILLFKNKILLSLSFLLLITPACTHDDEKQKTKLIQFDHYDKNSGVERYIDWDNNEIYITLPECFIVENYYEFSLTNEHNFVCQETHSFFSIDRISEADMDTYRNYFEGRDSTKTPADKDIILNYIKDTRISNLVGTTHSIQSSTQTYKQKEIQLVAARGQSDNYQNDLYYQFGAIDFDGVIYLLQFIVNEEDVYYYHKDIMKIFKSIRHA